jgi:Fe-S cluster biosynthesis and repair protein YggX
MSSVLSRRNLDAISTHARSLDEERQGNAINQLYADVCAERQREVREQEMRNFVIRHSVFRIHGVSAFVMILLVCVSVGRSAKAGQVEIVSAMITIAGLIIAASSHSIGRALGRTR